MKLKIINHNEHDNYHDIEIRLEQEQSIKNSFNPSVRIEKANYPNVKTNDELYSLAYYLVKEDIVEKFKQIDFVDEIENPIDFKLVKSVPSEVKIFGSKSILALKDRKTKEHYEAKVFDQYNRYLTNCEISLEEDSNIYGIVEGVLTTDSFEGKIKLIAEYEGITSSIIVEVHVSEVVLSEQEVLMNAVTELYEMIGGTK